MLCLLWNNDGGPNGGLSSLAILMEWMTTEGELLKYKGADDNKGEMKAKIAAHLFGFAFAQEYHG